MMMIASNSRASKGGKERTEVKTKYGTIWGEKEGNADYGVMVKPSQQHIAPRVKEVEWGLGTIGLRMLAGFSAGIPVEVAQEARLVPRCRRTAIERPF